jgi:hypothetical protein
MMNYALPSPLAEKLEGLEGGVAGVVSTMFPARSRALTSVQQVREDEVWRITGSGEDGGRTSAILRELWQWRDKEAQAADRPAFTSCKTTCARGRTLPQARLRSRHFSVRVAEHFCDAAEKAMHCRNPHGPSAVANLEHARLPNGEAAGSVTASPGRAWRTSMGWSPPYCATRRAGCRRSR